VIGPSNYFVEITSELNLRITFAMKCFANELLPIILETEGRTGIDVEEIGESD
jgi:hypothetical protein